MNRSSISFVASLILFVCVAPSFATDGGTISTVDAARAGLHVDWTTQVNVTSKGGQIVDIYLDVNEDRSRTFFAISYGNKREIISEYDRSAFGLPFGTNPALATLDPSLRRQVEHYIHKTMGDPAINELTGADEDTIQLIRQEMIDRVAEAGEAANNRKEQLEALLQLQNRDVEVKVEKFTLPQSSVYVATSTGVVQALDADTGETRWTNSIGNDTFPTIGLGASHEHVAVINGSNVYCLESHTGKMLWTRRCRGSVGASPVVSEAFVFVPLMNGRLEAFPIEDKGVGSESYVSIGRPKARPVITKDSVCWGTDRGYFTVASNREVTSPHYRLRSEASIVASGTAKDGILFIGSSDGFAYAIDEQKGSLLWEFSTGQKIKHAPIPVGDFVYLITDERQMFKLHARSGALALGWEIPITNVERYVGASKDKIYIKNTTGQVVAISQENGAKLSTLVSRSTNLVLPNYQTDRLYVGNNMGNVQCLREISSEVPFFHADEVTDTPVADNQGGGAKPAAKEKSTDPFAQFGDKKEEEGSKDPFSGFNNKEEKKDPFSSGGNNNDPFNQGGGNNNDPFNSGGNSSDPFSSGGNKSETNDPFNNSSSSSDDDNDPFKL